MDWEQANRLDDMAWYTHSVASRAVYLSQLLTDPRLNSVVTADRGRLESMLVRHADHLADPRHYEPAHNHGMFTDYGLFTAARALDHAHSARWTKIARRRFDETLRQTVQEDEALHLEHSPSYHLVATKLIEKAAIVGLGRQGGLRSLSSRMKDAAAAFVAPDGTLVQFGDSEATPAEVVSNQERIQVFPQAGYAAIRDERVSLFVTAGYHSSAHKHLDDTSFVMWLDKEPLIVDTGNFGYDHNHPFRQYSTSAAAHNVCEVSGDTRDWRSVRPTGSGVLGWKSSGSTFALAVTNPQLGSKVEPTTRLFVYRRDRSLTIIDLVRPAATTECHLHFAPGLNVTRDGSLWKVGTPEFALAWVTGDEGQGATYSLNRGETKPPVRGIVFPRMGEVTPSFTLTAHTPLTSLHTTTIWLEPPGNPTSDCELHMVDDRLSVRLVLDDEILEIDLAVGPSKTASIATS